MNSEEGAGMSELEGRIAGAPISWGVCEVPGWGWQYDAETVLTQMRDIGLTATEFGPDTFLPQDPMAKAKLLADKGLRAVGGFVPTLLHDPDHDPVPYVQRTIEGFLASGATALVLSADAGPGRSGGYDDRPQLDARGWATLLENLDRLGRTAAEQGLTATLHPHVGTMVENQSDVERVLDGSETALCLDTGHLMIGGADPVALAKQHPDRIRHVHLKDVDAAWARRVQSGQVTYTEAVRGGIYQPLGAGGIDIAAIVSTLEAAGYQGWYVLEQDTVLDQDPGDGDGGPVGDVRKSLDYLRGLA
jgi:inosose dehydratase